MSGVVRANLLLASEASGHWGYDTKVAEVTRAENHTGKKYVKCALMIEVDDYPAAIEFIISVESKIFTAEADKKNGRKLFGKCSVESKERNFFVESTIKDYLKWVVIP